MKFFIRALAIMLAFIVIAGMALQPAFAAEEPSEAIQANIYEEPGDEAECVCTEPCGGEAVNTDCPVCVEDVADCEAQQTFAAEDSDSEGNSSATEEVSALDVSPLANTAIWNGPGSAIQDTITNDWGASGGTITIATGASGNLIIPNGAVVTITSDSPVSNGNSILLTIGTGATVVWEADYSGAASPLVTTNGSGTFDVSEGKISVTGSTAISAASNVVVSGGTVSAAVFAINSSGATVTVSGGFVSAPTAAIMASGNINVSGGTVESSAGAAISSTGSSSATVTVSGGTVRASSPWTQAISALTGSSIIVSGGTVVALAGTAINATGIVTVNSGLVNTGTGTAIYTSQINNTININGGTVSASGTGGTAVIAVSGSSVYVSGGTVSAGSGSVAFFTDSTGKIIITGGTVFSGGTSFLTSGDAVVAFLTGTVEQGGFLASNDSIIVEVDSLIIPVSRDGTSNGLTIRAGGNSAFWDTSGPRPVINFPLQGNIGTREIVWGKYGFWLTIQADAGGSIVAGKSGYYEVSAEIFIQAKPDAGYVFSGWSSSNGGTFYDESWLDTIFTMPGNDSIVTAHFEYLPGDIQYPVIFGFGTWTGSGNLTGKIDGPFNEFVRLLVDGSEIAKSNYTVTEGSTIITLHESYLRTLRNGSHHVLVEFQRGYAEFELIINISTTAKSPKTGDGDNPAGWMFLMVLSALGIFCVPILKATKRA